MSARPVTAPICIDSSVAFKWFCTEDESGIDHALTLLRDHQNGQITLVAPAHLPAEVMNALACRNSISSEALLLAATGLARSELVYSAWDEGLLLQAASLSDRHGLTFYDALFPALAVLLECPLVTADRALARVDDCDVTLLS
jgi:predicted nucleic acid-binding protein